MTAAAAKMEEMVRRGDMRGEIMAFRARWESVACIDAFGKAKGITKRSDVLRYLIARGLEAEGW